MTRRFRGISKHLEEIKGELIKLNTGVYDLHLATVGAFLLASINTKRIDNRDIIELEIRKAIFDNIKNERVKTLAKGGSLFIKSLNFLKELNNTINILHNAIVFSGNTEKIVEEIKKEIDHVDYVVVYDCLSVPEFLVVASNIERATAFLETVLINPPGKTRYVGEQEGRYLRHYAQKLGKILGARESIKESELDFIIHEKGSLPLNELLDSINVEKIIKDIQKLEGTILVTTDHGYDVGISKEGYLYVEHGIKDPLLNFSKIAPFLIIGGE